MLRKINTTLLILIIVINGYVIIAPLLPGLLFGLGNSAAKKQQLQHDIIIPKTSKSVTKPSTVAATQPNHVIIPSMLLDQPILEGPESQQYKILNNGIWRFSWSSTPDKGGNTVLIGHRFTYTNPRGVFYFLNKVSIGDSIAVFWNKQEYLYKVVTISQVPPSDTAIEHNTANPELTLFTCTPLWLPKDRLVIVADLEGKT
jgi:sortase A